MLGQERLISARGIQQGDPLGPLLFSLALQPILADLAARSGPDKLDLVFSYLDDAVLAGDKGAVARAVVALQEAASRIGLRLNASKCEFAPACGNINSIPPDFRPRGFAVRENNCLKLLGAPVGEVSFCNMVTQKRSDKG